MKFNGISLRLHYNYVEFRPDSDTLPEGGLCDTLCLGWTARSAQVQPITVYGLMPCACCLSSIRWIMNLRG